MASTPNENPPNLEALQAENQRLRENLHTKYRFDNIIGTSPAMMDVLATYSINEIDIQTQQFSIQPVYNWENGRQILLGYSVTNNVIVKIREIDDAGSIIDAAVAAGYCGRCVRVRPGSAG